MSYKITVQPSGHQFEIRPSQTILEAAIEASINLPYGCRNGACGACKGKVLQGEVFHDDYQASALKDAELNAGYALFCCARPGGDLQIECREIVAQGIPPRILPARVEKLEKLNHDVMRMLLKLPSNERLQFMAGQYIEFILKDGKRRAFSIANAPHDDTLIELHLRLIPGGQFTEYVFNEMQEKTIVRIEAPFGSFFLREDSQKPIIFVAGGTGFAPIKGIIEHMIYTHNKREIWLYRGVRSLQDLYLADLPEQWQAQYPQIKLINVLSEPQPEDAWQGRTGLIHKAVLDDFADLSAYQVYCCGAPAMVDIAHAAFQQQGLPADEFFSDAFTFSNPAPKVTTPT